MTRTHLTVVGGKAQPSNPKLCATDHLLSLLPKHDPDPLLRKLERVTLPHKAVLLDRNQVIEYAYFPLSCARRS